MLSDIDYDLLCEDCALQNFKLAELPSLLTNHSTDSQQSVLSESELTALMQTRSAQDSAALNFLAAGRYNNFIPCAVRAKKQQLELAGTSLNELLSESIDDIKNELESKLATLSMMPYCRVIDDDLITLLANLLTFSHNGSTRTGAENGDRSKVLIPATVSPAVRSALRTRLKLQFIDLVVLDYDNGSGCLAIQQLEQFANDEVLAIILGWPNFFGLLEDFTRVSNWAKNNGSLLIALSSPLSLSFLKSPFVLTKGKVDYLLGELQTLGLPVSQSGNSPAFLASAKQPEGELNVYADAQKNINSLSVIQSYMSLSGVSGLHHSARQSNDMLTLLVEKLTAIEGVSKRFSSTAVNECVIEVAQLDMQKALKILAGHNMIFGYPLQQEYPDLTNCLLIYCSDQHTLSDIDKLVNKVATVVKNLSTAGCPVKPKFS